MQCTYSQGGFFPTGGRKGGWLATSIYLKACSSCLIKYYGGQFDRHCELPYPVSLTRTGIPRCIPSFHRAMIRRRDTKAGQIVKFYLSLFSISRLVVIQKKSYFYLKYKTICENAPADFDDKPFKVNVSLLTKRLAAPYIQRIPMRLGLRWKPSWTESPVPFWASFCRGGVVKNQFSRIFSELLSLAAWNYLVLPSERTGAPNERRLPLTFYKRQWIFEYISYCFAYFFGHRVVYPLARDKEEWLYSPIFDYTSVAEYQRVSTPLGPIPDLARTNFSRSLLLLNALIDFAKDFLRKRSPERGEDLCYMFDLYHTGKLGFKVEGAGKTRIFTIPNSLKQALLRPAHDWCMEVLRTIPQDGTFDQHAPIHRLLSRGLRHFSSFDLSAATDRFPLSFQSIIVAALFNKATHRAWIKSGLLTNVFTAPSGSLGYPKYLRFQVGQPLGLLSSWPLFALSHHYLVWHAAHTVYPYKRLLQTMRF